MSASDRYLVTGAAGFIGFHVSLKLLENGGKVIGVDNFNPYYDVRIKRARHAILEKNPNYQGVEADISDLAAMQKIFAEHRPTKVCNLAAQAGVRYSLIDPFVYARSNVQGFTNILELCKRNGIARLVYASSSSVYGGNTKLPFSESDPVDTPISLYAATKRANELMAHTYSHLFGLQTVGLRFFTVYGPWGRPDMAMWLFAKAISTDKPIQVFNNGDMQRDFTFIDDIVAGVIASLDTENMPMFSIINIGNNNSEHLLKLISIVEDALGKKAKRELLPMQPGDVRATYADITLAKKLLGFEPTTKIEIGVPKFIEWFKAHQDLV